ncbi:hypothetical protein CANCADRAFT_2048 [Tortispora caseinolytica NRRL Y-17796]|uniref:Protein arginine methyltransferase NDUFAF7 n=1 Tax=Tortispora caseinolytica NRRL Y-17796 TaxID=767744 RepID=A0A1E4TF16_9ASCO|nr:hypothetical protein CANCADRAFT_2048 [Tortispora caseinolytica NRRL Y-17796]
MRLCLTHPQYGYYTSRDPLGKDFITSPEISQMFGEVISIWYFVQWVQQNTPRSSRIVEIGPGRGTLMADMLRAWSKGPSLRSFLDSIYDITLIEASPHFLKKQHALLCGSNPLKKTDTGFASTTIVGSKPIYWHEAVTDIPSDLPVYMMAHEFFDALPIHSFEKTPSGWRELLVDYGIESDPQSSLSLPGQTVIKASTHKQPTFHVVQAKSETPSSKLLSNSKRYDSLNIGSRAEICPEALNYAVQLSNIISASAHGALLAIDYGADTIPANTFRAFSDGKVVSPFANPGDADLTADVDFGALSEAIYDQCPEMAVQGPVEQGSFLLALGIQTRAMRLVDSKADDNDKKRIFDAYKRLIERLGCYS